MYKLYDNYYRGQGHTCNMQIVYIIIFILTTKTVYVLQLRREKEYRSPHASFACCVLYVLFSVQTPELAKTISQEFFGLFEPAWSTRAVEHGHNESQKSCQ